MTVTRDLDESFREAAPAHAPAARHVLAWARPTFRHLVVGVSAVFLLPNALVASSFTPVAAAIVLLGCVGSLYVLVTATASPTGWLATRVEPKTFARCALVATALCVLGGEGHFFYANFDWLTRDAVLADLVRHPFPVRLRVSGQRVHAARTARHVHGARAGRQARSGCAPRIWRCSPRTSRS